MNEFDFRKQLVMSAGVSVSDDIRSLLVQVIPGAVSVTRASERDDRSGTDYWIEHRRGTPVSVDTKIRNEDPVDTRGIDDLALETWSVVGKKIGWTLDEEKRTDFILWWFTPTKRWVLVPFLQLQAVFKRRESMWRRKYQVSEQRTVANGNRGEWRSECVFVPRVVVWRAIHDDFGGLPSHTIERHGTTRSQPKEKIFDDKPAYTWCCLPCNATGIGETTKHQHRCEPVPYMRDFWISRLVYTFSGESREQIAQRIAKPVDRSVLDTWLKGEPA